MPRFRLPLLFAGFLISDPALAQQGPGCDIETSSYAVVTPPAHARTERGKPIVAQPQTPCPILPPNPDNDIGPIGIEVRPIVRPPGPPRPMGE